MPATYEPIETQTVSGASTSTITFSLIPQTYTDIVFVCDMDADNAAASTRIRFNGDSTTNYSSTDMRGSGASATSTRQTSTSFISLGGGTATNQTNVVGSIDNYSNTTTFKTTILRFNNPAEVVGARVGLFRSTSAITSIEFSVSTGNWVAGSTFTLFGIKAA